MPPPPPPMQICHIVAYILKTFGQLYAPYKCPQVDAFVGNQAKLLIDLSYYTFFSNTRSTC